VTVLWAGLSEIWVTWHEQESPLFSKISRQGVELYIYI